MPLDRPPSLLPPVQEPSACPHALVVFGAPDAATDEFVADQLRGFTDAAPAEGRSVVLLGAREPLRHELALAASRNFKRYVAVGADPGSATWNPLDTTVPGPRALAEVVVGLGEHLSGLRLPATERPLAVDLACALLAVARLPAARPFEPADLASAFGSMEQLACSFEAAVDRVYAQYVFLFELADADYKRLASRLAAVTIFPEDIDDEAAADPRAPALASCILEDGAPTRYEFHWRPRARRHAVLVDDRGFSVLRWLFSSAPYRAPMRGRPAVPFGSVPYANYELACPRAEDRETINAAAEWARDFWIELPWALQVRVMRRLCQLVSCIDAPRLRHVFSPRRARLAGGPVRETAGSLQDVLDHGACLALAPGDADSAASTRAVALLLRRQWQVLAAQTPTLAPVLVCDRYERLLTGPDDARADIAFLRRHAFRTGMLLAVVRSPQALVEAAGSLQAARRLLSAFGRIAVLPGGLGRAAGLALYLHLRCESAARLPASRPAPLRLRSALARLLAGAPRLSLPSLASMGRPARARRGGPPLP